MFYILNELVFNGESLSDEVRQIVWDLKSKYNDYYLEKIDEYLWRMWDKIVWVYSWITSIFLI